MSAVMQALQEVKSGTSIRKAAQIFQISRRTISRHRDDPFGIRPVRGRRPLFTDVEEKTLEDMIILASDLMIGFTKTKLIGIAAECTREKGKKQGLCGTKLLLVSLRLIDRLVKSARLKGVPVPGRAWYDSFLLRHPAISERVTQAQNVKKLKEWTPENADLYIMVLQTLKDGGYLDDPKGIWNFDESGFKLAVLHSKTLSAKGRKYVSSLTTGG